jgi:hypothetical protein
MHISTSFLLVAASAATAWMPQQDKIITARDGTNLFARKEPVAGRRWLSTTTPIRGVNLGSQFIFEPWIAQTNWKAMGCTGYKSEYDCVVGLGQTAANTAFQKHWKTWINETDVDLMVDYGLNTIRVPVGFWINEDLVYDSEHFPQGGLAYLETLCGWASNAGLYIIMDLHGAPGAQTVNNSFTGEVSGDTSLDLETLMKNSIRQQPASMSRTTSNVLSSSLNG